MVSVDFLAAPYKPSSVPAEAGDDHFSGPNIAAGLVRWATEGARPPILSLHSHLATERVYRAIPLTRGRPIAMIIRPEGAFHFVRHCGTFPTLRF